MGNLSPSAATKRVRLGILALAAALVVAVLMVRLDVAWFWRALLVFPFFLAGNGFFQGLYRS